MGSAWVTEGDGACQGLASEKIFPMIKLVNEIVAQPQEAQSTSQGPRGIAIGTRHSRANRPGLTRVGNRHASGVAPRGHEDTDIGIQRPWRGAAVITNYKYRGTNVGEGSTVY